MSTQQMDIFQHTDGGFYRYLGISKSTVDQSLWVTYEHVWPFLPDADHKFWHRPLAEWHSRFTSVTYEEFHTALHSDRAVAQQEIIVRRIARKEKERLALRAYDGDDAN